MMRLIVLAIVLFSLLLLFQLAQRAGGARRQSPRRGRSSVSTGLVTAEEERVVARVLNAAAWTYVAATLTGVLTLLYYLTRFGLLGGRRSDD